MLKKMSVVFLLAAVYASTDTAAQSLTIEEIQEAISLGANGEELGKHCDAKAGRFKRFGAAYLTGGTRGPGEYKISVEGPIGRIMSLARVAERVSPA